MTRTSMSVCLTVCRTVCLTILLALTGCVTTIEGDGPRPGTAEQRLKAQLDLARGYIENRDLVRAREPLKRALEIDGRSVEANVLMAILYELEGEPELVEKYYKRAPTLDSKNSQVLNNYGRFLYGQGEYDEAVRMLRRAVRDPDYPRRAQTSENLGLAEAKLGNVPEAEQAFQRALRLNAEQARSRLELAVIYFDKGNFNVARQYYDGYVADARQTPRSLWLCVRLSREQGDNDVEASCALALRNLYPSSHEYDLYLDSLQ